MASAVFLCVIMAGCSGPSAARVQSALEEAEQAAMSGNYEEALSLCDGVTQDDETGHITWRDYCRAAVVYAAAYDHDYATEASMASAARCLERARALQPDSVESFIASLAPAQNAEMHTVIQTLDALYTDHSTLGDHEEDDMHEHTQESED